MKFARGNSKPVSAVRSISSWAGNMVTGNEVSARWVVECPPEGLCARKFEACHHISECEFVGSKYGHHISESDAFAWRE